MAHAWNRLHWIVFLIFLKSVSGFKGWAFMNTQPALSKSSHFTLSPRAGPSLDIPVTGRFLHFTPSRSRSHTQAFPSGSNFASLILPQTERNLGNVPSLLKPQGSSLNIQTTVSHPVSRPGFFKYRASTDSLRTQSTSIPSQGASTHTGFSLQSKSTSWTPSGVSPMTSPWGSSQFGPSQFQSASSSSAQTPSRTFNSHSSSFRQSTLGSQSSLSQFSPTVKHSTYSGSSLPFRVPLRQFTSSSVQHVTMSEAAPQGGQGMHHDSKSQRQNFYTSSLTKRKPTFSAGSPSISFAQTPQMLSSSHYIHVSPTSPLGVPSQSIVAAPSGSLRNQKWPSVSGLGQGSPSQSSKVLSRFPSMSSAGNPSQFGFIHKGSSLRGLSSKSVSASCSFMPVKRG